jgi:7-carboxy-7-deazaguanine synthase
MQQPTLEAVKRVDPLRERFHVSEIFYSIQGEGTRAGMPCVFVRLQGCKLRCSWCDTPYALDHRRGGTWMSGEELLEQVRRYGCRFVEFTGGEPLEQWGSFELMRLLCDEGYLVAVETGGHVDIEPLDPRIICILDVKCPASRMTPLNRYRNLELLRPHDEVKFVIADRTDYEWAWGIAKQYRLPERVAAVLFSPPSDCWSRRRWRNGFCRTGCPFGCSCSCTSTSGTHRSVAYEPQLPHPRRRCARRPNRLADPLRLRS